MTRLVHVTTTDISLDWLLGPQLEAFAAAGYEVIGASAPGPYVEGLTARGIPHEPLANATRSWAPVKDVKAFFELYRLFRRLRPDIVHTHNPKPGVYGRIAARLARVPVVLNTVHGLYAVPEDRAAKRIPVYALERIASWCSSGELVQGPEDLETLASIGIPRRKLTLLGNGIDLRRFDPTTVPAETRAAVRAEMGVGDDEVVCGVVSRLVREKGLDEVFTAARTLRGLVPSARFVVIGPREPGKADGYAEDELEAVQRDAGVVLLGERSDMPAVYAAMDVLVFPSHREGFPRAPMEAAAMGRPVIASNVRGCREVVDDGVTGTLVPVREHRELARAVTELVEDPERRARYGAAAMEKAAREFDDRRVIAITLEAYERALTARKRPLPSAS